MGLPCAHIVSHNSLSPPGCSVQGPQHQRSYSFEGSRGGLGLGPGAPQHHPQDIGSMRSHSAAYARSASPLARMSASGPPEARTGFQFAPEPPAVHGNGGGNGGGGGFGDQGGLPVSGAYAAMGQAPLQQYGILQNQYMAQLQAQLAAASAPMPGSQAGGMAHSAAFAGGSGAGAPAFGGPAGGEAGNNNPNANNNRERHVPRPGSAASGLSNSFATAGPRSEPMQPQLQQAQQQAQGHRRGEAQRGSADAADVESSSSLDAKMNASVSDLLRGSSSGSGQPPPGHQQGSHQQQEQVQQQAAAGEWRHSWDGDTLQQQQRGESHSLRRSGGGGFSVPTGAFTNDFGSCNLVSSR